MPQTSRQDSETGSVATASDTVVTKEADAVPRRILIVEDNEVARRQLQQLLQTDLKLQVDATGDGQKALQDLAEHNYSIVITDLRMPRLDGMELIREVQQRRLPVRPRKPSRRQRMRFVYVHKIESPIAHQRSHHRRRRQTQSAS